MKTETVNFSVARAK